MGKNGIPDRWLPYSPMGSIIPGTRFIACKVPLKEALLRSLPENERFGPRDLLEAFPKMGLLVDLTNTTRYYFKQDFTEKNIRYEKIFCPGKVVPPNSIIKQFFDVVDDYLATYKDPDAVVVVHCTHGVNRTGYFICRYMIERLNISPEEALKNFQVARGHDIERDTYVSDLKNGCKGGNESDLCFVQKGFRRDRRGGQKNMSYSRKAHCAESGRNYEIPLKRHRNDYKEKPNDNYGKRKWSNNKHRHTYFDNSDGRRLPEEERKYSSNWRDHGRNENPPFQSKSALPQSQSARHLTNHSQSLILPHQTPKPPHHQEFSSVPSFCGARFPERGQFTAPPPKSFRDSTRNDIRGSPREGYRGPSQEGFRGPPREEFRGTSQEGYRGPSQEGFRGPPREGLRGTSQKRFTPMPKFCYPESSDEAVPSSRLAEDSKKPDNSFYAPTGNKTSTRNFNGNFYGRISSKGGGSGRGTVSCSGLSNWREEKGSQKNNLSR